MTRIIAGQVRGRSLAVPPSGTRPTSDRVREALFSMIAARMDLGGVAVLDLYAGSGALGLEAVSRGAARATLVERDTRSAAVIVRNIRTCGFDTVEVARRPVSTLLAGPSAAFDLVFSDPPYDLPDDSVAADLRALTDGGWLADDALVVVERSSRSPVTVFPVGLEPELSRGYGDTRIDLAVATTPKRR
ncbi:16S rRNA (guanine(966)-N(2))-methyltransferase RsmD [Williamsia sterculiae]|uniref:16S rRNA (Guanine966-N2)-methyltransferase n=1 Tax=Williamsia sterculiae TaxID=1344003 RepID=A0A1N7GJ81_9NOCA|nr:16S rRNA (guanine(966)-N(2))-methyltransferase RsmD [Williamsia sterculiae]SIS12651.1 16S rRNA (guanine966-N2)-methyltransferase [Williamsia sterculiae]